MKTTKRLLAMMFVAVAMMMAACEKDDDKPQTRSISLAGTTWESTVNSTTTQQGFEMLVNLNWTFDFNTDVAAEAFLEMQIEVPAYPQANQNQNETFPLNYKFDGKQCTVYYVDEETGEVLEEDFSVMRFDSRDTTFYLGVDDADMERILGVDTLVFHLTRGTLTL